MQKTKGNIFSLFNNDLLKYNFNSPNVTSAALLVLNKQRFKLYEFTENIFKILGKLRLLIIYCTSTFI